uniref:Uncharacterized protein n=1 Tax=Anguilla anguilla TaxID=7936 RepID=A0A0E9WGC5_ANGAN
MCKCLKSSVCQVVGQGRWHTVMLPSGYEELHVCVVRTVPLEGL